MYRQIGALVILVVLVMISVSGALAADPVQAPAPVATMVRPADGAVMVYVPAGEFLMGSTGGSEKDEIPQHSVYLDAYWIDQTEMTNQQFKAFVESTGYQTEAEKTGEGHIFLVSYNLGAVDGADWRHPDGPDSNINDRMEHPVVQVSANDARAYCEWAGARLPTEAEWEKAARGVDGRRFPWGEQEANCEYVVMWEIGVGKACGQGDGPWPVGSKPAGASPYGALDMSGNVSEWTADWYDPGYYAESPASNPPGPDEGELAVNRGGSWPDGREYLLQCTHRCADSPNLTANTTGFRCAVSESDLAAPAAGAPTRVLFIGDCHSWFLEIYLPKLAASSDSPIVIEPGVGVRGGYSLEELWNEGEYFSTDLEELVSGEAKWDFVVIGVGHWCEGPEAQEYTDWVPKYDEVIKRAGAQTVLTTVWPDQNDTATVEEYKALDGALASQLDARVAPVGLAVDRVMQERPDLIQYVDEYHLNAPGWYLDMCVLYATLFERSPVGLTYRMDDIPRYSEERWLWNLQDGWALSDEDAAYLQQIAWDTVQEYRAEQWVQ